MPPPAPASAPQENVPVVEFQINFPDDGSQAESPAPKRYPPILIPLVISSPPAIVDVAVVEVALKLPKVGVDVAVITPEALVERSELTATDESVVFPETVSPPFRV